VKRAAMIVSALVVLLAACGDRAPLSSVDSGIRGVVVSGPRCPVVTVQDPCPDLPVPGIVVRVIASDGSASKTRTDAAGQFNVAVAPGEYVLQPVVDNGGATFAKPLQVTVSDAGFVEVTLHVDTGIR
jgi:hypothetical protein